jgi:hypothetical protein
LVNNSFKAVFQSSHEAPRRVLASN